MNIKKLITITALTILPHFIWAQVEHITVHKTLKPYFERFVNLMEDNDIKVDYSNINYVDLVPLADDFNGYYNDRSKSVCISMFFQYPVHASEQEFHDLVLICLAHEIGHALGWEHTDVKYMGLMNPGSNFDMLAVKGMGAEQYILNTYKKCLN